MPSVVPSDAVRLQLQNQDRQWSRHAARYDDVFLNPYAAGVENPLWEAIAACDRSEFRVVADLGCGTGPLLPHLHERFDLVYALDFAPAMLAAAKRRLAGGPSSRVIFLERAMHELDDLAGQLDLAIAVNSLVMPDVRLIDRSLAAIHASLRPGGRFLGIVPSIDAILYQTMLLYDQALGHGLEPREAQQFTAFHGEHRSYDFALGRFRYQGLKQKFWHPFEVEYRLGKAAFREIALSKVLYPWDENLAGGIELSTYPRSWDWFFTAKR